jgi:DnaJ-class molecular chaperone
MLLADFCNGACEYSRLLTLLDAQVYGFRERMAREQAEARKRKTSAGGEREAQLYSAYAVLHLAYGAPREVVTAAYRALSRMHHPDKGGDAEVMKQINAAYSELEKL